MPKKQLNPYSVQARADGAATLRIFGDIGVDPWADESIAAADVVKALSDVTGDLDVRINSYGGSVSDGLAIHNALLAHQARGTVSTSVDGVAYSIANLIAMGATSGHRSMAASSLGMVHAPWGITVGNAEDHRDQAETLDRHSQAMAAAYTRHGVSADVVAGWLSGDKDHYFTPDEAIDAGLADSITGPVPTALASARSFGLDRSPSIIKPAAAIKPAATAIKQEPAMEPEKKEPKAVAAAPADINAEVKAAVAAEAKRSGDIRAIAATHANIPGIDDLAAKAAADTTVSVADFGMQALSHIGKQSPGPVSGGAQVIADERDKFAAGCSAALQVKTGRLARVDAQGNEFLGLSLVEMARASARMNGIDASGDKMDMVGRVLAAGNHSTSDFASVLMDAANKSMLMGWEENEESFQQWTQRGSASDFKAINRVDMNLYPSLPRVPEGAEFSYASIGDRGEVVMVMTYGSLFSITRQAIINDDLSAFTRVPMKQGRAALRTVGDMAYAILTGNPLMSDGVELFDAAHGNELTGAVISTASVDAMRVAMATQTDPEGNATGGLNIRLANLLVPVALEGTANVVRNSEFVVGSADEPSRVPNSVRDTFDVISDARLDADSAATWYGTGANTDTVEITYLDGRETPYLETKDGWNVDGVEMKVRIDVGAKALDYRGMARNVGA